MDVCAGIACAELKSRFVVKDEVELPVAAWRRGPETALESVEEIIPDMLNARGEGCSCVREMWLFAKISVDRRSKSAFRRVA